MVAFWTHFGVANSQEAERVLGENISLAPARHAGGGGNSKIAPKPHPSGAPSRVSWAQYMCMYSLDMILPQGARSQPPPGPGWGVQGSFFIVHFLPFFGFLGAFRSGAPWS